jgi:hypothetical protein
MEFFCRRFLWTLLAFLSVETTWAYIAGPDNIRECPKCRSPLVQQTMMSGNTFGARFWTDGKMVAPMLPDQPWLVKCPKCGTLFWMDEARKLEERNSGNNNKKWPDIVPPGLPSETDFLGVLTKDKLAQKKELYVRRQAWWLANDAYRTNSTTKVKYSPAQVKNIQVLSKLLDEKDPNQRILKAEAFRELGQFQECIKLLSGSFKDQEQAKVVDSIRELAIQKSRLVCEIK